MATRDYPRQDIVSFGKELLRTGDLDPIYLALDTLLRGNRTWTLAQVERWLVAYWCVYHAGSACHLSTLEGPDFWAELHNAAANEEPAPNGGRWPRGHERRHFRGAAGVIAVEALRVRYRDRPEEMVEYVAGGAGPEGSYSGVANRVMEHRLFGPWISFKVCDMLERVLEVKIDFTEAAVFMFDDPVKAALMLWRQRCGLPEEAQPKNAEARRGIIHQVVENLTAEFRGFSAPPRHERLVGLQEVETILCKWKSHCNGHYPSRNDITEIRDGLTSWANIGGRGETAVQDFLGAMPDGE